ncbi:hypothetical protein H4R21_006323, partial [Coemansia helicoidea]
RFERRLKLRQRPPQQSADDAPAQILPLPLQSDFANLVRMATISCSAAGVPATSAHEAPIGGASAARRANENQYWSCIVDHLRRAVPPRPVGLQPQQ